MPFVKAQCENCHGLLEVDSSKKAAICPYCGTPYVVQDAINNYNTHIEHLHADVVNVSDDRSAKARLDAADAYMKMKDYVSALLVYEEVAKLTPQNYLSWWGQIRAYTYDFTRQLTQKQEFDKIHSLFRNVLLFVPPQNKSQVQTQYDTYYEPLYTQYTEDCAERQKKILAEITERQKKISTEIADIETRKAALLDKLNPLSKELSDINQTITKLLNEPPRKKMAPLLLPTTIFFWSISLMGYLWRLVHPNLLATLIIVFPPVFLFIRKVFICPLYNEKVDNDTYAQKSKHALLKEQHAALYSQKIALEHQIQQLDSQLHQLRREQ